MANCTELITLSIVKRIFVILSEQYQSADCILSIFPVLIYELNRKSKILVSDLNPQMLRRRICHARRLAQSPHDAGISFVKRDAVGEYSSVSLYV